MPSLHLFIYIFLALLAVEIIEDVHRYAKNFAQRFFFFLKALLFFTRQK